MDLDDLYSLAGKLGVGIGRVDIPFALFHPDVNGCPVILLPLHPGKRGLAWALAHELGHFALGHYVTKKPRVLMEIEAWHWAKQMLRPRQNSQKSTLT